MSFFATPWPVNFLAAMPVIGFLWFRKGKLGISRRTLTAAAVFGIAFGFVEAACVIYIRATLGFLPGYLTSLTEAAREPFNIYQQNLAATNLPKSILSVELFREAATMVMLLSIAYIGARKFKERFALFLWTFAFWDIFYYVWLWCTIRWPYSLATPDVLFLIPVPWYAPVWWPILVSALTILAVGMNRSKSF